MRVQEKDVVVRRQITALGNDVVGLATLLCPAGLPIF